MTSQRFCLRWNNHQSNLLSVFDQLLHDESFVDVTLAVDGRYLKAHKIVLSACSPYFQALFVGHPDRHPIVILKDIPYVDMRSLLDFMYRGEVSVDQDRLTTFLKVAESLRIKGLTEVNEDQCDLPKMASSLLSNPDHLNSPLSAGSISLSYRQRLKRHMSGSQHGLNTALQTNNPLLGSALTGPKRKRGLPRKLSGSLSAGLDVMPDGDEEEEGGGMCEEEVEEEYDEERSVASDSDMIERSDSPFDNKMLEVNMSEAKPPQPHRRPSSEDESSVCNMEERGEGGRSPSPGREEEGGAAGDKPLSASQELVSNVKAERDTEGNSGGDQTERTSPTPERFPPGKKQPFPHRRDVSVSKRKHHQTLSKSITYDLNPDVSLTRGIIYAEHSGDECEIIPVAKRVNAGRPMRRSKRVRLANAQDSDIMAADVVECEAEDVLRSLTKLTPGALESNGYCEETGVFGSGVHFLTSESLLSFIQATDTDTSNSSSTFPSPNFPSTNLSTNFPSFGEDDVLTRKDLLEYLMNSDGTCACKLCGEVLTSRTHWYRHKYKVHTPAHLAPPVSESKLPDLHSCAECKQYFKSKKGYLGHLQAKHNIDCDETTHAQTDTPSSESSTQAQNTISVGDTRETRIGESRPSGIIGQTRMSSILVEKDYAKQRELEEKLVKDIIDKVKRECEAQGDNAMSRKGYTKKMRK